MARRGKRTRGRRPARARHVRPALRRGPAAYSGRMDGFAVHQDPLLGYRYCAYGSDGAPLTASLSPFNFCVWATTTQFPYLTPSEANDMTVAMHSAGLAAAMGDALVLVLRNSLPELLSAPEK